MEPFALVILGASGDLASRKLLPAVHRLFQERLLPEPFAVVGFARTEMSDAAFRDAVRQALARFAPADAGDWPAFARCLFYHRGAYYDQAGALRDMVQNHMMHLLCLVGMEPPNSLDPRAVRDEKVKVLKALRTIPTCDVGDRVVRAQYAAAEGVPAYRDEPGVAPDSRTESYVALKTYIDNWRWADVPFYLRTGKRLAARITEIGIHFKPVPQVLFNAAPFGPTAPNVLALRIQPDEGISLQFQVKRPGAGVRIEPLKMAFGYEESFGDEPPEAYERLLLDAALGDPTLFTRSDEVEAAWAFVDPLLEACAQAPPAPLPTYPAGTWGPPEADALIEADGRRWTVLKRRGAGRRSP